MGKNYTVYIKHPKFGEEPNKSGLLNELLEEYYNRKPPLTSTTTYHPRAAVGQDSVEVMDTTDWGA